MKRRPIKSNVDERPSVDLLVFARGPYGAEASILISIFGIQIFFSLFVSQIRSKSFSFFL